MAYPVYESCRDDWQKLLWRTAYANGLAELQDLIDRYDKLGLANIPVHTAKEHLERAQNRL